MHNVQITGLHRITNPKPNQVGHLVLGNFDCVVNGFRLINCAFVKTNRNGLTVWTPRIEVEGRKARGVAFVDDSLRHEVMMRARDAYRQLGGTDVDTIGSSGPIGSYAERVDAAEGDN